ncbi:class I SAM-dependent methyltransferase [Novosphingobium sp. FSW06-99]|uniref:class I SAM-dependent methyltransferase n=1 Tax=Novosphingobium sp. FSW06-99 TaxID=1739113 RepID=UPI001E4A241D|nr:methyltransferase domain-containing protein [Novosphingobium sp. FSW06-99]
MSSLHLTRSLMAVALIALTPAMAAAKGSGDDHPAVSPAQIAAAVADSTREADNRALDEGRKPAAVLAFAKLRRGDVVADWGAGAGYYSELLADAVGPKGVVYAIGIAANYHADAWAPVLAHHANVRPLFVPGDAQALAPNSLDAIFAHLEYHDLYWTSAKYHYPTRDVDAVVRNWFAALRPGGRVIVVDHAALGADPRETVEKFHRIDPARVKADFARAGFVLEEESAVLHRDDDPHTVPVFDASVRGHTDRFVLRFVKPS